jgi:hypothetical protein
MPGTIPECAACTDISSTCSHRQQYQAVEQYIKELNLAIDIVDVSGQCPEKDWLAGKTPDYKIIWIWHIACRIYGWAMLTSVLLHEFGHLLLFDAEHISEGEEAERKANEYGRKGVPVALVPELYQDYREFFLLSHITPGGWDEQRCLAEYEKWLDKMIGSSQPPPTPSSGGGR